MTIQTRLDCKNDDGICDIYDPRLCFDDIQIIHCIEWYLYVSLHCIDSRFCLNWCFIFKNDVFLPILISLISHLDRMIYLAKLKCVFTLVTISEGIYTICDIFLDV